MKVILKHVNRHSWSGVKRYKNCIDSLGSYFTRSGRLYTGLSKEDEKELGEELGYDLRPGSEFWDTFRVRITGEDMIIDTEDPMDKLKYLFLRNHKRIKNGLDDNKPTANYVLVNKEEEAKKTNEYGKIKRKAYREFDKMKPKDMRKALRIFGQNPGAASDEMVEARLTEYIENSPNKFIDKWVDNKHRATEYLVKEAVSNNIIRKNKTVYKYGSDIIGNGLMETIAFLDNPENQELKLAILNELDVKK